MSNKQSKKSKKIVSRDIHGKKTSVDASKIIFRPSVYGILIERGKILLSKQWDGYDFPGGGIDTHETVDQALRREFWEETGLKVKADKLISCQTNFFTSLIHKKYWNSILIYYTVKKVGGKLSLKNVDEHEANYMEMPEWIDIKKASGLKFYNGIDSPALIRHLIKQAAKMK